MNVIGFHNPEEKFGFLSNWYLSDFVTDGIRFSSMEQFMMYRKAMTFEDRAIASEILQMEDVARIKELGRLVSGYEEQVWNGVRQILIYEGLLQKFAQNEDLKRKLLDTGDSILAECAVKDQIWGIGLSMKDPNRLCPSKWKGQNLLGYSLMITRDRLRENVRIRFGIFRRRQKRSGMRETGSSSIIPRILPFRFLWRQLSFWRFSSGREQIWRFPERETRSVRNLRMYSYIAGIWPVIWILIFRKL